MGRLGKVTRMVQYPKASDQWELELFGRVILSLTGLYTTSSVCPMHASNLQDTPQFLLISAESKVALHWRFLLTIPPAQVEQRWGWGGGWEGAEITDPKQGPSPSSFGDRRKSPSGRKQTHH